MPAPPQVTHFRRLLRKARTDHPLCFRPEQRLNRPHSEIIAQFQSFRKHYREFLCPNLQFLIEAKTVDSMWIGRLRKDLNSTLKVLECQLASYTQVRLAFQEPLFG